MNTKKLLSYLSEPFLNLLRSHFLSAGVTSDPALTFISFIQDTQIILGIHCEFNNSLIIWKECLIPLNQDVLKFHTRYKSTSRQQIDNSSFILILWVLIFWVIVHSIFTSYASIINILWIQYFSKWNVMRCSVSKMTFEKFYLRKGSIKLLVEV